MYFRFVILLWRVGARSSNDRVEPGANAGSESIHVAGISRSDSSPVCPPRVHSWGPSVAVDGAGGVDVMVSCWRASMSAVTGRRLHGTVDIVTDTRRRL